MYVGSVGGSTVGRKLDALPATVGGTVAGDTCPKPKRSQFTLPISTSPTKIQRRSFILGRISAPEYQNDADAPIESVAACPTGRGTGQNGPPASRRPGSRAVFFSQASGALANVEAPHRASPSTTKPVKPPSFSDFGHLRPFLRIASTVAAQPVAAVRRVWLRRVWIRWPPLASSATNLACGRDERRRVRSATVVIDSYVNVPRKFA